MLQFVHCSYSCQGNKCNAVYQLLNTYIFNFAPIFAFKSEPRAHTEDSSPWAFVSLLTNMMRFAWTDKAIHHITVSIGYLPVNYDVSDCCHIKKEK